MRKFFTLFLVALMGIGQLWAGQAHVYVYSSPQAGGFVDVQTSNAAPAEYTNTKDHEQIGGTLASGNKTFYLFYKANPGYNFRNWYKTNESNYNNATTVTNTSDLTEQGQSVTQSATGIGAQNSYYAGIFIPIKYYMAFHGNGATSGEMAKQTISYDAATKLTTNAFVRQYAVSYDANEGECSETGTTAQYTFSGWAKSENGAVVYSDGQSVKNLTTTEGEVFDLYAVWTDGSITLPSASKTGFLFDGWYNGDVWVGTAGSVIAPTADMNLVAHWAEKYTPMFVLDKTEIELDQTAQLTLTNVNNPSIEITPAGIVSFNAETGVFTGVGVGTATISVTQEATDELAYKHEELTLTVSKKTPSLSVILKGIEQSSVTIYQGKTTTVAFNKVSDAEVEVSVVSGGIYASYQNGVITAGEIGTAVFRATLPETDTYKSTYADFQVIVESDPIHLPLVMSATVWNYDLMKVASEGSNSWDDSKGIVLGDASGGGFNNDDKYVILHFEGIPDKLTFEIAADVSDAGSFFGGVTNVEWYIQESKTQNMGDAKIWTETRDSKEFSATQTVQLDPTTRYVKLCYSGNFAGDFRNVRISELKYVQDPEPATIDFGTAVIYSGEVNKTVNVNWCNIAPMKVESSNPRFSVSPAVFGNYDQMGSQEITISYTHTAEVGANEADITISNGNQTYTKTVHVSAETAKRAQSVTWHADLVATGYAMNVGEQYPDSLMGAVAVVPSKERVTFTSLDPEIIEVVADTALLAKKVGTVLIAAYQAGDAEYAAAKDTVLFTVTNLRKQTITWDQNLYGLLTTSEPVELTATATSGMKITYTSADESVVRIDSNMLIVVGEGETTITAYQAGGVDENEVEWLPISLNNYVIVRNPASQCNGMALTVNLLVLNSDQLSSTYDLAGTPTTLTFSAKHGTKSNGAWGQKPTYAALMVDQYAKTDGVWGWYTIYNAVVGTDDTPVELSLNEEATKVRFRTTETGTDHTITNIRIPRKKFLRTNVEAVDTDAETNVTWTKDITISHSNIDLMTILTKQGILTLSANTLGKGCGDFGDDVFTASFTPTEKNVEYLDTIVITDGKADPATIEIPVRLYTTGMNQYIENFELPEKCITSDIVAPFAATATSELEVIYLSSDSAIAYVEGNQLKIVAAGQVDITAYQAGNEKYNPASLTKTITIGLTPIQILEAPTATEVKNGEALGMSKLFGGKATVEGSFAWTNAALILVESGNYEVTFTPLRDTYYATAVAMVPVTVTEQPTTYGEYNAQFCEGDSVEYAGKWYFAATTENIPLEEKNIYGGDSVVVLTVTVLPTYLIEEKDTIYVGTAYEWYGEYLNTSKVGTFNYKEEGTAVNGCDSTVALELVIIERPTTYGAYDAQFCEGDSVEYAGKWYFAAITENIPLEEKNIYGGDSVVVLTVTVLPTYLIEEKDTVYVGTAYEWNGEYLNTTNTGTFNYKEEGTAVNGCDSIVTLELVVIQQGIATSVEHVEAAQTAVKEFRNGVIYIRREGKEYTTDGKLIQ